MELSAPYQHLLIVLFSLSIVLQVVASCLLLMERITCKKENYEKCKKYNAAIGILVMIIILINVLATAFGGPE
jgi:hypothetical protein